MEIRKRKRGKNGEPRTSRANILKKIDARSKKK